MKRRVVRKHRLKKIGNQVREIPVETESNWKQGWYNPNHPEKYVGEINHIRYMSSWELQVHKFLDDNPNIIQWSSETIKIPYIKPTDKRVHYYYPDYWIKYKNRKGQIVEKIVELKPSKYLKPSKAKNRRQRLYEDTQYAINLCKWQAAKKVCDKYGIPFQIITEKDLLV